MPTKRFDKLDPERRKRLLAAAREEFIRNGYEGASLNTIVKEAEISKGSLYYYFEDKADLYLTVIGQNMEEIYKMFGCISLDEFSEDFWADVESYCKKSIRIAFENPNLMRLLRGIYHFSISHPMPESIVEFYDKGKAVTAEILKRGQKMGEVREDIHLELLVNIVFSLGEVFDFWLLERWKELTHEEIERTAILYTDLCRRIAGT